jgi:hypothetical protein
MLGSAEMPGLLSMELGCDCNLKHAPVQVVNVSPRLDNISVLHRACERVCSWLLPGKP